MELGSRIKQLREANSWTQVELAKKTGISQNRISLLERSGQKISFGDVVALADAFSIDLEVLRLPNKNFGIFVEDYKRSLVNNTFAAFISSYDLCKYQASNRKKSSGGD